MIIVVKGVIYVVGKKVGKILSGNGILCDCVIDWYIGFSNWELMGCEFVLWIVRYEICKL